MKIFIVVLFVFQLASCINSAAPGKSSVKTEIKGPTADLLESIKNRYAFSAEHDIHPRFSYEDIKLYHNKGEVISTLQLADSVTTPKGDTFAFIRYSIGSKTYKDLSVYRKIDGIWGVVYGVDTYYSEYTKTDVFGYGNETKNKDLAERIDEWK